MLWQCTVNREGCEGNISFSFCVVSGYLWMWYRITTVRERHRQSHFVVTASTTEGKGMSSPSFVRNRVCCYTYEASNSSSSFWTCLYSIAPQRNDFNFGITKIRVQTLSTRACLVWTYRVFTCTKERRCIDITFVLTKQWCMSVLNGDSLSVFPVHA